MELTKSLETLKQMIREAYRITDVYSNYCPIECVECEKNEGLLLLPSEQEIISERLGKEKNNQMLFRQDGFGNYYEASNCNCTMFSKKGRCTIYKDRPLDCRSFPVVPRFSLTDDTKVQFFISDTYCPLGKNISKLPPNFIHDTVKTWKYLVPMIPLSWKKLYNERNAKIYVKEITKNTLLEVE